MAPCLAPRSQTFTKASSLHFLIHPGYTLDSEVYLDEWNVWEKNIPQGKRLLARYLERARQLKNDALLIMVPHDDLDKRNMILIQAFAIELSKLHVPRIEYTYLSA